MDTQGTASWNHNWVSFDRQTIQVSSHKRPFISYYTDNSKQLFWLVTSVHKESFPLSVRIIPEIKNTRWGIFQIFPDESFQT